MKGCVFGQTNHRAYVTDNASGEPGVWFFGTTLGSPIVHLARALWRIPWHRARYTLDCAYNPVAHRYDRYRYRVDSDWCAARVAITDSGEAATLPAGFASLAEMQLLLTHPVDGYFYRTDGALGTYSVWHDLMQCTRGEAEDLYFSMYEARGIAGVRGMPILAWLRDCDAGRFVHCPAVLPHALGDGTRPPDQRDQRTGESGGAPPRRDRFAAYSV